MNFTSIYVATEAILSEMSKTKYTVDDSERHSRAIIDALSDTKNTHPLHLAPLYDSVDVDILNKLCEGNVDATITFEHEGCKITVKESEIEIEE